MWMVGIRQCDPISSLLLEIPYSYGAFVKNLGVGIRQCDPISSLLLEIPYSYGAFVKNLGVGLANLSPYYQTLLVGFLAVISINVVIVFYIYMAMKEPSDKHEPDPTFLANAKASIKQTKPEGGEKEE
uniref:Vacuolar ATPase assembly integral membrane protein VMA21 homolog n=1 Tax=Chenopodium quinoa TaxID=63459 RepID=A0A803KYM3_CHEQI